MTNLILLFLFIALFAPTVAQYALYSASLTDENGLVVGEVDVANNLVIEVHSLMMNSAETMIVKIQEGTTCNDLLVVDNNNTNKQTYHKGFFNDPIMCEDDDDDRNNNIVSRHLAPKIMDDVDNNCCHAMTTECLSCMMGISSWEYCDLYPCTVGCATVHAYVGCVAPYPNPGCVEQCDGDDNKNSATCQACLKYVSVLHYCLENENENKPPGCNDGDGPDAESKKPITAPSPPPSPSNNKEIITDDVDNNCCHAMTTECLSCKMGIPPFEYCDLYPCTVGCATVHAYVGCIAPYPNPGCVEHCNGDNKNSAMCQACLKYISVLHYCLENGNEDTPGCNNGDGSDTESKKLSNALSPSPPQSPSKNTTTGPSDEVCSSKMNAEALLCRLGRWNISTICKKKKKKTKGLEGCEAITGITPYTGKKKRILDNKLSKWEKSLLKRWNRRKLEGYSTSVCVRFDSYTGTWKSKLSYDDSDELLLNEEKVVALVLYDENNNKVGCGVLLDKKN